MLKTIKSLILIVTLAGCAAMPWTDTRENALRQEAGYLAGLVKKNKISKVQAGERDRKRINQDEAQSQMQKKLAEVRARYRQDPGKPGKTPVFTNFMMELYGLPSL